MYNMVGRKLTGGCNKSDLILQDFGLLFSNHISQNKTITLALENWD